MKQLPKHIRIQQRHEPLHFLKIFHKSYIVHIRFDDNNNNNITNNSINNNNYFQNDPIDVSHIHKQNVENYDSVSMMQNHIHLLLFTNYFTLEHKVTQT